MDSSGHRANILGKAWDVIGIGAYKGPTGKKMWTVLFADKCGTTSTAPKPTPKPTAKPKPKPTPRPTARPKATPTTDAQARQRRRPNRPRRRLRRPTPTPEADATDRRRRPRSRRRRSDTEPSDEPQVDPTDDPSDGFDGAVGMRVVDRDVDRRPALDDRRRGDRLLLRRLTWSSRHAPRRRPAARLDRRRSGMLTPRRYTAAHADHPRGTRADQVLPARSARASRRCAASRSRSRPASSSP